MSQTDYERGVECANREMGEATAEELRAYLLECEETGTLEPFSEFDRGYMARVHELVAAK